VSDSALRNALSDVRRAIHDTNRDDPVIQTVPKRGYILNGSCKTASLSPMPRLGFALLGILSLMFLLSVIWFQFAPQPSHARLIFEGNSERFRPHVATAAMPQYCEIMPAFRMTPDSEPLTMPFSGEYQPDKDDFSIEIWVKPKQLHGVILDQRQWKESEDGEDLITGYAVMLYNNKLLFQLATDYRWRNFVQYSDVSGIGQWIQLVVTVDRDSNAGGMSYVNARLIDSFNVSRFHESLKADVPLSIGKDIKLQQSFDGEIGLIRFYQEALTLEQVQGRYQNVKSSLCPGI